MNSADPSVTNIYPILAGGEHKSARLLVIAVGVLHAAIALAMKVLFYSYTVGGKVDGAVPEGGGDSLGDAEPVERAVRALAGLF